MALKIQLFEIFSLFSIVLTKDYNKSKPGFDILQDLENIEKLGTNGTPV